MPTVLLIVAAVTLLIAIAEETSSFWERRRAEGTTAARLAAMVAIAATATVALGLGLYAFEGDAGIAGALTTLVVALATTAAVWWSEREAGRARPWRLLGLVGVTLLALLALGFQVFRDLKAGPPQDFYLLLGIVAVGLFAFPLARVRRNRMPPRRPRNRKR